MGCGSSQAAPVVPQQDERKDEAKNPSTKADPSAKPVAPNDEKIKNEEHFSVKHKSIRASSSTEYSKSDLVPGAVVQGITGSSVKKEVVDESEVAREQAQQKLNVLKEIENQPEAFAELNQSSKGKNKKGPSKNKLKSTSQSSVSPSVRIRLLNLDKLKKCNEIPRYPECQNMVEYYDEEGGEDDTLDYSSAFIVFVSHCWLAGWNGEDSNGNVISQYHAKNWRGRPHPDSKKNEKFRLLVDGIESCWFSLAPKATQCYVWIDFACINQNKDPAGELEYLDQIVQVCDILFTPIVDYKWNTWDYGTQGMQSPTQSVDDHPHQVNNWFEGYKAETFRGTPFSYLSRAWCRVEMLFAANIPFLNNKMERDRIAGFMGALKENSLRGIRSHVLYGTKEHKEGSGVRFMPTLTHSFIDEYNPLKGSISVKSDKKHIALLLEELKPLLKTESGLEVQINTDVDKYENNMLTIQGRMHGTGKFTFDDGNMYTGAFSDGKKHGEGVFLYNNGAKYEGEYCDDLKEGYGVYHYENGDEYAGYWLNNKRHGKGTFTHRDPKSGYTFEGEYLHNQKLEGKQVYVDGSSYEGTYQADKKNGYGKYTYPDGITCYIGDWVANEQHGHGVFTYLSGSRYEGQFQNNQMHGTGVYRASNGDVFQGSFLNDMKHGDDCVYTFKDGDSYQGSYRLDLKEGQGRYQFVNGDMYEGEWQKDQRSGTGRFVFANQGGKYEGQFNRGQFQGKGTLKYPNGAIYEGSFQAGKRHGKGKYTFAKGSVYIGEYDNDYRQGFGKLSRPDGSSYTGDFLKDDMSGSGIYEWPNGDKYDGEFKNNKRWGRGVKISADGTVKEGLWKEDEYFSK